MVEKSHEAVEVATHVEETERLGVQAELVPRVDLEELLDGLAAWEAPTQPKWIDRSQS